MKIKFTVPVTIAVATPFLTTGWFGGAGSLGGGGALILARGCLIVPDMGGGGALRFGAGGRLKTGCILDADDNGECCIPGPVNHKHY